MALYTLQIPDFDDDVGQFIEIMVTAETEDQARQRARELRPDVAWDTADCVRMRETMR